MKGDRFDGEELDHLFSSTDPCGYYKGIKVYFLGKKKIIREPIDSGTSGIVKGWRISGKQIQISTANILGPLMQGRQYQMTTLK